MLVHLIRRDGTRVPVQPPIIFEGGDAQSGVLATFTMDGREMTGRVVAVSARYPDDPPDWEPIVTIRAVDMPALNAEAEAALASLPVGERQKAEG